MYSAMSLALRRLVACAVTLMVGVPLVAGGQDTTRSSRRDAVHTDSIARLKVLTIVATPAERAQPVTATHVDATTIRLTPANNTYELLRQTAGMEVHEQGQGPGFASNASLRGFSSDHSTDVALWIDGVPINEPMNGHSEGYNDWSLLFPGGIQDIDVVRGPTSALFGNFALAAVVNVRTLERMRGTELTGSGGSFGRADAMLLTGFDHGARGGGVLGARYERDDGFRPNSRYDIVQGHARVVHDLRPGVAIDAGAELYGGNWNSPGFLSADEFERHDYAVVSNPTDGGYKRRAQERVSLRVLSGNTLWRTTVYATEGRWQLLLTIPPAGGRFEGSGSQTEEEDTRAGAGATTALTWSLARGEITVGGETRWDRSRYENYFTTARVRDSVADQVTGRQLSGAPFIQSYFNLTDALRVDLGVRYDALATRSSPVGEAAVDATHGVVSPKIGALVRLAPALGLYGNVSRGFRSPDGVISDPTLAPITAWSYESGVKLDRGASSLSAAMFRMDVSNEQTFNPITLTSSSGGASRRQGVELEWRTPMVPRRATLSGDWTFNDARYRSRVAVPEEGDGAPVVLNGLRVFNTSKYVGAAALDLLPGAASWRIRLSGNWVGPYSPFDEPGVVLGAYGLAHLSAAWTLGRFEADVGVRNVFDRAYPEMVAGGIVAPGQPRTVYVSLRFLSR
ncbi:MAG TPA: TonB-dependent receptor [Gemmatimonadaceae bacterium]|nr:TonB-dependent receptor [Gemmatimonadaceae bacterium]